MKKLINLIALVMLVSTNVFTPFSYAGADISEVAPENKMENVVEDGEIPEISEEISELDSEGKGELEQGNLDDDIPEDVDIQNDEEIPADNDTEENKLDEVFLFMEEISEGGDVEEGNIGEEKENANVETGDLSLESPINPELYVMKGDSIECGSGYVLNADGTGCELIQVTFDANGGEFEGGGSTEILEPNVSEAHNKIYKYSHTENINDNGVKQDNYGDSWTNSNIRGTDRTSALSQAHVLTFPGSSSLTVDLYYNGESVSYDWVSVWKGSYPNYTAASNYGSAGAVTTSDGGLSTNKYGGSQNGTFTVNGNTLTKMGHSTLIIPGDTVTFGFKSDSGGYGQGYGYYAVVEGEGDIVEGYECAYDITTPTREGYVFDGWYTDTGYTQIFDTSVSECLTANTTVYAKWYQPQEKDIIIEVTATSPNQILNINKYFNNAYSVYRGDGTTENLTTDMAHVYSRAGTYMVVLSLASTATRWTFKGDYRYPLVPKKGTSVTGIKIISMPSLASGFGSNATNPGNSFFSYFNSNGALESLPEGSFDTSNITKVGEKFFTFFNQNGMLTSLPAESFKINNITVAGDYFFGSFNKDGQLIILPEGSFDTSHITSVGVHFFSQFNRSGALISLPEYSFNISNIVTGGQDFFAYFNSKGALTSLPDGSFDTSNVTAIGKWRFFSDFNSNGALTSLPDGSFRFSTGLTNMGNEFFYRFNAYGALKSLPEGSFDTSHITSVGDSFFRYFNDGGALTSLPDGSFRFSTGLTTVENLFFYSFNSNGALTSLPDGSFDTSNITEVGAGFFEYFNAGGALTSLPDGSFDISNITTVDSYFFSRFNQYGKLENLPEGSFKIENISEVGWNFFEYFNDGGALTSLPEGSFKTENITTVGYYFFQYFNRNGALTSLPDGSFRFSTGLTTVENSFFDSFNYSGALTSLPEGSFNVSNISTVGTKFFNYFNYSGAITSLPDSFTITSVGALGSDGYQNAFNSPNYTLNRKVSDMVSGVTVPNRYRNTFSNNQPGRCGVNENWLVNKVDACSITFDVNGGIDITNPTKKYAANTVSVGIWVNPIRDGHIFSGWYTASTGGTKVTTVTFPDMDGQTLYAHWESCGSGYTLNKRRTSCVLKEYTITYDLGGGYLEDESGNKYEGNQVVTYVYDLTGDEYIANFERSFVKRNDGRFLGWYTARDGGEQVYNITSIDMNGQTLYAHWEFCESGYTRNNLMTSCVLKEYTITYDLGGGYLEDESGNKYEGNQVVTYVYNSISDKYISDLQRKFVKRENSKFLDWYTSEGEVFDFGIIPPETSTAYAKYGCDLGYLEDETKSSCEKVRVEFDANGGSFEDGEKIFQTEISFVEIPYFETKILHTPNLTDEGNYLTGTPPNGCTKANGSSNVEIYVASTGYIQIEGAKELRISIKYGGGSYGSWIGTINVWTGNNGNRLPVRSLSSFPVYESYETSEFIVEGDSIYIAQSSGYPNYGRFITVSGTGKREVAEYPDGVFNNILPIREGHNFMGRYLADGIKFNTGTVSTGEITYVQAKRECADGYENKGGECIKQETKPSGGSSGGGGGGGGGTTKPDTPKEEQKPADTSEQVPQNDNSVSSGANAKDPENESSEQTPQNDSNTPMDSSTSSQNDGKTYSTEFQEAYEFAKGNGITTMPTIQKADMSGKLTRIQMAKMLSQYAINVLGQTPDTSKTIKFSDVTAKRDADYDNGVTLAYQLGIMGQNMPGNKFRPNDEVSRAEFVTALSRLLYSTSDGEYKSTSKYYIHHVEKLVKEGIITVDDPKMKERRGYVMIMLMRSAK